MICPIFSEDGRILFFDNPLGLKCGITTTRFGDARFYGVLPRLIKEGRRKLIEITKKIEADFSFAAIPAKYKKPLTIVKPKGSIINLIQCDSMLLDSKKCHNRGTPALMFPTADCPILIISDRHLICGIHSGKVGIELNIVGTTINNLNVHHGLILENTRVIIWPGISAKHYTMDLSAIIKNQLEKNGIPKNNISIISGFCSYDSKLFSSHRGGDKTRNIVFMRHINPLAA